MFNAIVGDTQRLGRTRAASDPRSKDVEGRRKLRLKPSVWCLFAAALLCGALLAGQARLRNGALGGGMARPMFVLPENGAEGSLSMGVFLGERRVGDLNQYWSREDEFLTVDSRMGICMDALIGQVSGWAIAPSEDGRVWIESRAVLFGRRIETLLVWARLGRDETPLAVLSGNRVGENLDIRLQHGEQAELFSIALPPEADAHLACFPLLAMPRLGIGAKWPVFTLDPFTMGAKKTVARVVGREILPGNSTETAFVIRVGHGSGGSTMWADSDGRILRKSVMGLVFAREEAPLARFNVMDRNAVKEDAR